MTRIRALPCWVLLSALAGGVGRAEEPAATQQTGEATEGGFKREINAEAGYPGLFAEYVAGMNPSLQLGGRFTFNYGFEGDINKYAPGIKLQGLFVFQLPPIGPFSPAVRIEPGLFTYFFSQKPTVGPLTSGPGPGPQSLTAPRVQRGATRQVIPPDYGSSSSSSGDEGPSFYGTVYGSVIPIFYQVSFPVVARCRARAALGVSLNTTFGNGNGGFFLPIQAGAGISYELQPDLDLRVDYAVGPQIYFGSGTNVSYEAWIGVGWHP